MTWHAHCPVKENHKTADARPSLRLWAENGRLNCHCYRGCTWKQIVAYSGTPPGRWFEESRMSHEPGQKPDIECCYDYRDENGKLRYQVVRMKPKDFRQRRPDGKGWAWDMQGVSQLPYCLPQILASPKAVLVIVEGEKDADRINWIARATGVQLVGTCNSGGALKWSVDICRWFAGRRCVIIPDQDHHPDEPLKHHKGKRHAYDVAGKLMEVVPASIRVVNLPTSQTRPDLPAPIVPGAGTTGLAVIRPKDVSEYLDAWKDPKDQLDALSKLIRVMGASEWRLCPVEIPGKPETVSE